MSIRNAVLALGRLRAKIERCRAEIGFGMK